MVGVDAEGVLARGVFDFVRRVAAHRKAACRCQILNVGRRHDPHFRRTAVGDNTAARPTVFEHIEIGGTRLRQNNQCDRERKLVDAERSTRRSQRLAKE